MSACTDSCPVWMDCGYEYRGNCECVHQRKFKPRLAEKLAEKAVRVMRENKLAIEDMNDPWQVLAFTFYNMLLQADELIALIPKLPEHGAMTSIEKWMHAVATGISGSIDILGQNPKALQITVYQAMKHALEHGRGQRSIPQ